jgi:deoxyribonuclease-4
MRLGAHVSISGSLDLAVDRARALGCDCLQIFYGSPRQWRRVAYSDEVHARFIEKRQAARLDPLVVHAAYLVNLAAPDPQQRRRSVASLLHSARGSARLGGLGVVTHLGSSLDAPRADALRRVAASIRTVLEESERTEILLENSTGAGGILGAALDDLARVLDRLHGHPRVGICLDTAHLFAAGWDLRTPRDVHAVVTAVDRAVGWDRVRVFHLNDSQSALASQVDRHENIGEGQIGLAGFRAILAHPRIRPLPGIIETPGFDQRGPDRKNLARLRRLQRDERRSARTEVVHGHRSFR